MTSVLVVREFDDFSRILTKNNFSVINCAMIKTSPLEDLSKFESKLVEIENYDGVFLTSRQSAQIFVEKLRERNIIYRGKIYVLGRRSFHLLKTTNLDLVFDETANTVREFLNTIPLTDLKAKRFLFVRGEKSLRVVPEFLEKIAMVDEMTVYRTEKITVEVDKIKTIRDKIEKSEISCACFFSPSGAESFIEQFGAEILHQKIIAAIGKTTAEFFEKRNLKVGFVSSKAKAEDFAVELIEHLGRNLTTEEHG